MSTALYIKHFIRTKSHISTIYAQGATLVIGLNTIMITYVQKIFNYLLCKINYTFINELFIGLIVMILFYPIIVLCDKYCRLLIGRNM